MLRVECTCLCKYSNVAKYIGTRRLSDREKWTTHDAWDSTRIQQVSELRLLDTIARQWRNDNSMVNRDLEDLFKNRDERLEQDTDN